MHYSPCDNWVLIIPLCMCRFLGEGTPSLCISWFLLWIRWVDVSSTLSSTWDFKMDPGWAFSVVDLEYFTWSKFPFYSLSRERWNHLNAPFPIAILWCSIISSPLWWTPFKAIIPFSLQQKNLDFFIKVQFSKIQPSVWLCVLNVTLLWWVNRCPADDFTDIIGRGTDGLTSGPLHRQVFGPCPIRSLIDENKRTAGVISISLLHCVLVCSSWRLMLVFVSLLWKLPWSSGWKNGPIPPSPPRGPFWRPCPQGALCCPYAKPLGVWVSHSWSGVSSTLVLRPGMTPALEVDPFPPFCLYCKFFKGKEESDILFHLCPTSFSKGQTNNSECSKYL